MYVYINVIIVDVMKYDDGNWKLRTKCVQNAYKIGGKFHSGGGGYFSLVLEFLVSNVFWTCHTETDTK